MQVTLVKAIKLSNTICVSNFWEDDTISDILGSVIYPDDGDGVSLPLLHIYIVYIIYLKQSTKLEEAEMNFFLFKESSSVIDQLFGVAIYYW